MSDLDARLEQIAEEATGRETGSIWSRQDYLRVAQAASQATARYCAEMVNKTTEAIAKAKNEEGNTEAGRALQKAVWATFTCELAILRECGVKE